MKLPDAVQAGAEAKAEAELKPLVDKLVRLRSLLDAYEGHVRADTERRITNTILAALGLPEASPYGHLEKVSLELGAALTDLLSRLPGAPPPEPAPPPPPPPAPPTPRPPPPPRELTAEDAALANKLFSEVDGLRANLATQHPTRLYPLLQAITAEVKMLQERIPEDHDLYERLGKVINIVNALRIEGKVDGFIKGLAFGSQGDWARLAVRSRRKVEEFDADAATPPKDPEPGTLGAKLKAATKNGSSHPPPTTYNWPALPKLRAMEKPLQLVGGKVVQEKIRAIHDRFGLDVEWHEIEHDNPRASATFLTRIRAGKLVAIIFLDGLMRNTTYKPLVEACGLHHVMYAMADRAGTASLEAAILELESKLCGPPV